MRKIFSAALAAAILTTGLQTRAAEVHTSAVSAILMEASSGRVLYEKNAHELRLIASITKLMTALVAVGSNPDLTEEVTIQQEWLAGAEGSSIYLRAGEVLTLEELLYGMLLASGNDAAQAVACHCAGDMETFAQWMNQYAAGLGMNNSHFINPSGLNADGHYSTAYDMALCAKACMENEVIAKIVGTRSATMGGRTFTNHNKLLSLYEGCIGLKTGYTQRAGRTLVSCAERNGIRLIAVTLTAPDDWNDHMALYDYGFQTYQMQELCAEGQTVASLPVSGSLVRFVGVAPAAGLTYPLRAGENVETVITLPNGAAAPVTEGKIAGRIEFHLNGREIGQTYLVYRTSVESNLIAYRTLRERFLDWLRGDDEVAVFGRTNLRQGRSG